MSRVAAAVLLALGVSISLPPRLAEADEPTASTNTETFTSVASDPPGSALNEHERALAGTWYSEDTSRGAAAGTMTLDASRHLKLQVKPIGTLELPALEGSWSADAKYLHLEVASHGKARVMYKLSSEPKLLDVLYENGMGQLFVPVDGAEQSATPVHPVLP